MEETNASGQEQQHVLLGDRLRALTAKATVEIEKQSLTKILVEAASKGQTYVQFEDLRLVTPNMINAGEVYGWLQSEAVKVTGGVDQETAAHKITISWQ